MKFSATCHRLEKWQINTKTRTMKHNGQNILGNHRGVSALWVVICLGILTGFAALVVDGGFLFVTKHELQNNADVAALAAGMELQGDDTDVAAVKAKAVEYSQKQVLSEAAGYVLTENDVIVGNWDTDTKTFSPGGVPTNGVQVTTRRTQATGNPVNYSFAPLMGYQSGDVLATAVAFRATGATGIGSRFLCDDDMLDTDNQPIIDLAEANGMTPEYMLSSNHHDTPSSDKDDWFLRLPAGSKIQVPTGQASDPGLLDMAHGDFPFTDNSWPATHEDFLNYNEDGTMRDNQAVLNQLDPLYGVSAVTEPELYDSYVNPDFVQVCPIYKSDVDVDNASLNTAKAKGERRGLLAFKILEIRDRTYLPDLYIEIVDPSTITSLVDVKGPSQINTGSSKIRLVY